MSPWPYPLWIAHRGAGKLAPENTLAAFKLGAQHGYRMFECDAKLSADGQVFLLHDATLERTTNAQGTAGLRNWTDLARLDAGAWHSVAYAGEHLCRLSELSAWCVQQGHMLNIEIKPTPGQESITGEQVALEAARCWAQAPVPPLLTSFQHDSLLAAKAVAPDLPRGLLLDTPRDDGLDLAQSAGCVALVCRHALWQAATVQAARSVGLRLLTYTVNDAQEAQRLIDLGIDGIITDRVDVLGPGA